MRLIDREEVKKLLPMGDAIEVVARSLTVLARGKAGNPLRSICWLPDRRGALGFMPASMEEPAMLGAKIVSVFPGNSSTELDSHQGVVLLFEGKNGRLLLVADGSEITAIRTAAASAVATRVLAREDAHELAILGTGVQAASHVEAMLAVRPITEVRVFGVSPERTRAFALRQSERHGVKATACGSAREAVEEAAIVCTTTSSHEPVLKGVWLAEGTHINAVGACFPSARELDTDAVVRSRLFVDLRESARHEAGDFIIPRDEGAITDDHIQGELGELLLGKVEGRRSSDEITLFKSLGIGTYDLACAAHLYQRAREEGLGVEIELGGMRR